MWAKDTKGPSELSSLWRSWLAEIDHPEGHVPAAVPPLPRHVVLEICQMLEAERPLARSFDPLVSRLLVSRCPLPTISSRMPSLGSHLLAFFPREGPKFALHTPALLLLCSDVSP